MSIKQDRMAERIQQVLSQLLMREVSDPRLQAVTVTDVQVDQEIMFARIYVNALGDEGRREEVMSGLKHANGFLRRELAQRIRMRNTPELRFIWDEALERADRVERLLDSLDIPDATPDEDDEFDLDLDDVDLDGYDDEETYDRE
jgi:ribosome-binding factor A